jgi:thymidylate kinase
MTLVVAIEGPDGCSKSTTTDRVAHMTKASAFHHDTPRGLDVFAAAIAYRTQREVFTTWRGRLVIADRWWMSSLALSHAIQSTADAAQSDEEHDRIVAHAQRLRSIALDERASEASRGLRVVTVYLRASLDTLRARTSPARRGGDRWRALPQTLAAYEALAPTWCQHVVDAEQRPECVAADVALIVQRERRV